MAQTKYGEYIKSLSFRDDIRDDGAGFYRQGVKMGHDFHGQDIHIQYGTYWTTGRIGREPYDSHIHDFDQVLIWIGADTDDIIDLGAEVELCLGKEREKHVINTPTAVSIPKGLPHLPATIVRMDRRFIFMVISCAPEWKATPVSTDKTQSEVAGWQSKYRKNVVRLSFVRKGAWIYGPLNPDDAGGAMTTINPKDVGFDFHFNYDSVKRAPFRFGPNPDHVHVHSAYTEYLLFMGVDCNDLSELGAEAEISLGKEGEKHRITTPTLVVVPKGFPHGRTTILKLDKPFLFWDISLHPENVPPSTRL